MTDRLPPLNALRALATLSQTGRVGAAAAQLGVTHAAVSHHIRNLEDWFGLALVRRSGRQVALTDEGERLAEATRAAMERIAAVCRDVEEKARRPELTIACVPSFATRWLIPRLVDFAEVAPTVRLRLFYALHGAQQDADIAIDWWDEPPPADRSLTRLRLLSGHTRPVCSPLHLERFGPFGTPTAFAGARLLHDEHRVGWRQWLTENGLPPARAATGPVFDDFNLLVSAVLAGHGIALCVESLIEVELTRGDLIPLTGHIGSRRRAYWLTAARQPKAAARTFIDWIATRLPAAAATEDAAEMREAALDLAADPFTLGGSARA